MRELIKKYVLTPMVLSFLLFSGKIASSEPYECDVNGDARLGLEEAIYALRKVSGVLAGDSLTVLDCGEPVGSITNPGTLSTEAKSYILCKLNEIRSQVALGVGEAYGGGTHPAATNMQRLQWDDNLATVASNYAANCNYSHNSNRTSDYSDLLSDPPSGLYVGENIYASSVNPSTFTYVWAGNDYGIAGAIDAWSSESTNWTYGTTYNSSTCPGGNNICGHFTQNVWAKTTKVGCGYYNCSNGLVNASGMKTFVVCNFETGGNYSSQSVYLSGNSVNDVCTEQVQTGDTCENGLITPIDYTTGLDYECDVDGDGELGLEEVINALRILSGMTQ